MKAKSSSHARLLLAAVLTLALNSAALSAPAADRVFPSETVAFFSIADPSEFETRWQQTQLGQLAEDESMQPFIQHLRGRIVTRFGNIERRLGMTIDDLLAAAGGEVGVGMLHKGDERASVAVMVNTAGKSAEAEQLIAKVETQLANRGGEKQSLTHAGTELTVFFLPKTEDRRVAREVVHFRRGDLLVAVDGVDYAKAMADAAGGAAGAPLAERQEYAATMKRCRAAAGGLAPDLRWFANPFAWDDARRSVQSGEPLLGRNDTLAILREQGFDAIRGVGGYVNLAVTKEQDLVHRTAVYAPPKPGTEGQPAREKYRLAMRMAQTENRRGMTAQAWAPRETATYATCNIDLLNVFDHAASLFDAMSGYDGAFENTIGSFEDDPFGPQINLREQLVRHLGSRVTMVTDYEQPITIDCERYLFVVEVKNSAMLQSAIDKLMENDGAVRRDANGIAYWEVVPEDETLTGADLGDDLLSIDDLGAEPDEPQRAARRSAVCLHDDQLIVASDVTFLRKVLFGVDERESLVGGPDFQETMRQLDLLAPGPRCSWSFRRMDENLRPSYELVRQGLMPQSQTFFGRILNELLTTQEDEEQGIIRKQRVDGSQLPSFELVRRYFGPAARAVRADDDGWFVTGVLLNKEGQ